MPDHPETNVTTNRTPDPVDEALVALFAVIPDHLEHEQSRVQSRRAAAFALDDAVAEEARSERRSARGAFGLPRARRRPILAVVGGLAAAVVIAGALTPWSGDSDPTGIIAVDASAAQALEAAAERMLALEHGPGSGTTWHAVSSGSDGTVDETWYDAARGESRWARYQPAEETLGLEPFYLVVNVDAEEIRVRQYVVRAGTWKAQVGGYQTNDPIGSALPGAQSETLQWLAAITAADDVEQVAAANRRFHERTRDVFAPPAEDGSDLEANLRAVQALHLLRVAAVSPEAVALLYRDVADLTGLERLPAGTFAARDAVRVQLFPLPDGDHQRAEVVENVLVLDAETGAPLGTETPSGGRSTRFEAPVLRATIGEAPASCGPGPRPPCALLDGTGPIVADADARAARNVERCPVPPDGEPPACPPPTDPNL